MCTCHELSSSFMFDIDIVDFVTIPCAWKWNSSILSFASVVFLKCDQTWLWLLLVTYKQTVRDRVERACLYVISWKLYANTMNTTDIEIIINTEPYSCFSQIVLTIIKYSDAFVFCLLFLLRYNCVGGEERRKKSNPHMLSYADFMLYISCRFPPVCMCAGGQSPLVKNWQEIIVKSNEKPLVKFIGMRCCHYITIDVCVMDLFDLPFTQFVHNTHNTKNRKPLFYVVNRCEYEMNMIRK